MMSRICKPRGPPNWTQFALRRILAWSLMEKGVTVGSSGSSLSGTKRGKCFLLASVVVRFEWHSLDGDFSLFDQIHGWFSRARQFYMLHGYFAPRPGRQPMIDLNPRFKCFFCSSWSSQRGEPEHPKALQRLWGQKAIVPFNLESFYQSLQGTNFIPGMREVWKEVICVVIV